MVRFVTPLILLALSVLYIIENVTAQYGGGDYSMAHLIIGGWAVVALTIVVGFGMMLFKGKDRAEEKSSIGVG